MSEPKVSVHAHDYWWGLYENGELVDVICWHYQLGVSDFDYPVSPESDYLVLEVQIEPI